MMRTTPTDEPSLDLAGRDHARVSEPLQKEPLLENVGMDAAVRLGDPALWKQAVDERLAAPRGAGSEGGEDTGMQPALVRARLIGSRDIVRTYEGSPC